MLTPLKSTHILLADDDPDDRALFAEVLTELELPVTLDMVHNGEELITSLLATTDTPPDILFLDLNMPRKSGLDCLQVLKQDESLQKIPVVMLTTSNDPAVISKIYKTGASYYIRKPNTFEELKSVVRLAISLLANTSLTQPSTAQFVLSP